MATFYCIITEINVSEKNFDKWKKLLRIKTTPLLPKYAKLFKRYGANSIDEYINIINNGIKNNTISELTSLYESKKDQEMAGSLEKEKQSIQKRISTNSDNITVRMLTDKDENDAANLYILFKETMDEDTEKAVEDTQDFILKNIMFGIFVKNVLAGFVIIDYKRRFFIDESFPNNDKIFPEASPIHPPVDAFYIQELLIHPDYRGQKLSKQLIEYCIMRCPKELKYIALMTMPSNVPLIKIAQSCGFVPQKKMESGNPIHSLVLIRNMDKVERTVTSPPKSERTSASPPKSKGTSASPPKSERTSASPPKSEGTSASLPK